MKLVQILSLISFTTLSGTMIPPVQAQERTVTIEVSKDTIYDITKVKNFQSVVTKEGFVKTRILFSQKFALIPEGPSKKITFKDPILNNRFTGPELTADKDDIKDVIDSIMGRKINNKVNNKQHPILEIRDKAYDSTTKNINIKNIFAFGDFLENRRRILESIDRGINDVTITEEQLSKITENLESVKIITDIKNSATATTEELTVENLKKYGTWRFQRFDYPNGASAIDLEISWAFEIEFDPQKKDITAFAGIYIPKPSAPADSNNPPPENPNSPKGSGGGNSQIETASTSGGTDIFSAGFLEKLANRPGIDTIYAYGIRNSGDKAASYYGFEFNTPGFNRHARIPLNFFPFKNNINAFRINNKDTRKPSVFTFDASRIRSIVAFDKDQKDKSVLGALSWTINPSISFYYGYNLSWPQNNVRNSPAAGIAIKFSLSALGAATPNAEPKGKTEKIEPGPITVKTIDNHATIAAPSLATKAAGIIYDYSSAAVKAQINKEGERPLASDELIAECTDDEICDIGDTNKDFFIDWRENDKPVVKSITSKINGIATFSVEVWDGKKWKSIKQHVQSGNDIKVKAGSVYRIIIESFTKDPPR